MSSESPFLALGNVVDPGEVRAQVEAIVASFAPGHDASRIVRTFDLVNTAFSGALPGYRSLRTPYHDSIHTHEVTLCTARILHGLDRVGYELSAEHIDAALIGALLHDVGYLTTDTESDGSGAQFTECHVGRSVDFACRYLDDLPDTVLDLAVKAIWLTDHRQSGAWLTFDSREQHLSAAAMASADLLGQMSNRAYLERLLLLYLEYAEADFGGFVDYHDLLEKTLTFYRHVRVRLERDLKGVSFLLTHHFNAQKGVERNYYADAIHRNLDYLERLLQHERATRLRYLRRGDAADRLLEFLKRL
ncbi:MAG TPA: hypothetical protein VJ001_10055 [Rhodocyclaceae bacterium]|nr:hypothetical protein [Rhodocyclaceae bacterium]